MRATALAIVTLLALAATAGAKTTVNRTTSGGVSTLSIVGDAGEAHDISVGFDYDANRYEVFDDSAALAGATNCSYNAVDEIVLCTPGSPAVSSVVVTTADSDDSVLIDLDNGETTSISTASGDDFVSGVSAHDDINGGAGDDVVDGGDGNDTISGSGGDDALDGGGGDDTLRGDDGSDSLVGDVGTDALNGGIGADTADYSAARVAVTVDLDGNADDGPAGEHDNVKTDVENITGGSAGDTIIGGTGSNVLSGNDGDDQIFSKDESADKVLCGKGKDSVASDTLDTLEAGACEATVVTPPAPPTTGFKIKVTSCDSAKKSATAACVSISCPGATGSCVGEVALEASAPVGKSSKKRKKKRKPKKVKLGSAKFTTGNSTEVKIKLSSGGRKLLKTKGKLVARATVNAQDSSGGKESDIASLRLQGPSKRR